GGALMYAASARGSRRPYGSCREADRCRGTGRYCSSSPLLWVGREDREGVAGQRSDRDGDASQPVGAVYDPAGRRRQARPPSSPWEGFVHSSYGRIPSLNLRVGGERSGGPDDAGRRLGKTSPASRAPTVEGA